jgi:hypothetical protein
MNFGSIFTISGKGFLLNLKFHPAQTATRTRSFTPGQHKETDKWALGSRGPHPSARPNRGGTDRWDLGDGEVFGQAKVTSVLPTLARTRRCPWRVPRSSKSRPPPCMAEWRRGSSLVRLSQPRHGEWRCSGAVGTQCGACAREKTAGGEVERRCPRSGVLR